MGAGPTWLPHRQPPCEIGPASLGWLGTRGSPPSYRDLEKLMAKRGLKINHTTVCRWGAASGSLAPAGGQTQQERSP